MYPKAFRDEGGRKSFFRPIVRTLLHKVVIVRVYLPPQELYSRIQHSQCNVLAAAVLHVPSIQCCHNGLYAHHSSSLVVHESVDEGCFPFRYPRLGGDKTTPRLYNRIIHRLRYERACWTETRYRAINKVWVHRFQILVTHSKFLRYTWPHAFLKEHVSRRCQLFYMALPSGVPAFTAMERLPRLKLANDAP